MNWAINNVSYSVFNISKNLRAPSKIVYKEFAHFLVGMEDIPHFVDCSPINGHLGCFQSFLFAKFCHEKPYPYDISHMNLSVGKIPEV